MEYFLYSFTPLLYSTALKHQPPHFDTRDVQRLLIYLSFFLLHTSFSSTTSNLLINPNLLIPPRWSGLTFAAIIVQYTPYPLYHIILHCIIDIVFVRSHTCRIAFPVVHHTNTHALRQLGRLGAGRPPSQTQRRKQNPSHASQERVHGSTEARQA